MASYRCMICDEAMVSDHNCLEINISDFSIMMELLGLSYESITEPEKYTVPPAPEHSYTERAVGWRAVPMFLRM